MPFWQLGTSKELDLDWFQHLKTPRGTPRDVPAKFLGLGSLPLHSKARPP